MEYEREKTRWELEELKRKANKSGSLANTPRTTEVDYSEQGLTQVQRKLLDPGPEELVRFAGFLRQDDTGLIRLLPQDKYESVGLVSATDPKKEQTLPITGGGSCYSFTKRSHIRGPRTDIWLNDNRLESAVEDEVIGLMTALGDIPLENVVAHGPGVEPLANFAAPKRFTRQFEAIEQTGKGFSAGGFIYRSKLPVRPGMTYVMRSIAYGRSDVLIGFRVLRQDEDGSVTMLWKKIKAFGTPKQD